MPFPFWNVALALLHEYVFSTATIISTQSYYICNTPAMFARKEQKSSFPDAWELPLEIIVLLLLFYHASMIIDMHQQCMNSCSWLPN